MYNLRLVAADALDLCVYDLRDGGEDSLPQRLQTSMSLYSTSLAVSKSRDHCYDHYFRNFSAEKIGLF
jgi:hypothetical protein